jgi:hypothetical protein
MAKLRRRVETGMVKVKATTSADGGTSARRRMRWGIRRPMPLLGS